MSSTVLESSGSREGVTDFNFKGLGKYPKFKSSRHYSGWDYPNKQSWRVTTNNRVNGYLNLRDLNIIIQMRGRARTWGIPKTCTIFWRNNKWYASITVECCPGRQTGSGAIGLDFGSKVAIATSDGELIESPKFLKRATGNITQRSSGLRRKRKPEKRKVKASRRWKKCQARISKVKRKVANQRQDWTHKVAAQIVGSNSLVATEKLNLKGMTRKGKSKKRQKAGLNRNLLDVAIGMLRESIKYKVIEAGGIFLEAPTQQLKPTQRCNNCWELTPKTLCDRVHVCSHCGHTANRDINAAQVCLTWARGLERASLCDSLGINQHIMCVRGTARKVKKPVQLSVNADASMYKGIHAKSCPVSATVTASSPGLRLALKA